MADLKLKDFVEDSDIQKLIELDNTIGKIRDTYKNAALELAKGLKINVDGMADLEKLGNLYNTQAKVASSASAELTEALRKQSEITQAVSKRIEEKLNSEKLSATELKKLTKANEDNAASLEKAAKAESNLSKAQNAGNITRKKAILSEEERIKIIRTAISLTNQEVNSRSQAKEVNKQLQKAVDVLKDTDENYIRTLARLNSTIGINTDYIKRNSDRYTQQKMTIGAYREEVKAAIIELKNGNNSMQNMGIIARRTGGILKNELSIGLNKVGISTGTMAKGFVAGQLAMKGLQMIWTELKQGIKTAMEFEATNSKLAAILGTTSDKIKELKLSARELGATTKYTASEATNLQLELAKLGFSVVEIQQSTKYILQFAQATGAGLSEAAALAGAALRMFNADTTETERYVSAMAVATTKSALSFSYLQTAMPIAGSVAKTFGFEIEDVLALLGKLADAGVDASSAATATRNILLNLANGGGKLSKTLGGNVKTLDDFVKGLKQAKDKGIELAEMLDITDKRSVNAFANFVNGADDIEALRKSITGVTDDFAKMADEMGNNTAGSLKGLSSAWDELMITIYGNTGIIRDTVDLIADAVRDIATLLGGVQQVADKLANKGNTYSATEEDYKKDLDVIEKRTQVLIKAGEKETEAKKKARKEQLDLLNMTLLQENKALAKAKEDYENAYANSIDDSASKYIRENAKSVLKALAIEYSTYQSSVNVLEARRKRLGSDIKPEGNTGSGVSSLSDKEKRELEKAARERQKLQEQIQESELSLMDEGLNKELAKISLGYNKKIAAIKGGGKDEIAARNALGKEMKAKLDEFTVKYNSDRERKDVENALAVVKKGSQEELDLKLHQLELQREAEIDSAEKTGEDVFLIDEKYAKKRQELYEKHASDQVLLIAENAAHEQSIRDEEYIMDTLALKKQLASKEITQQEYAEREYQLKLDYARKTTEAAIDALEMQLNAEKNLGPDERAKLAEQLQKAKADLARQEAEAEIEAIEKIEKADEKSKNKRIKNVEKWLQVASQAVGAIGDLVSTVYDGQIEKIEKEQDANDEKYDKDIERIENLAETGAITEEEAEARKRAAKIQTESKNKELERQKQEIAYKQAIWNKGTQVAETGIATARGIMEAFKLGPIAGAIMAAVVGAMGAIQVATILATPIPSYAEGTKDTAGHRGGTALVGDAGKQEVVMYKGQAWITPDTPTLVDIPKGAQVFPDVDELDLSSFDISDLHSPTFSPSNISSAKNSTIVVNDYSRLEKRIDTTNNLLLKSIKQQREDANNRDFENYKRWKLS
ncbi:phage tail tape measure protein [Bacteroides thetaiotaomicron]|jgi:TP901 family phage tail tape measure protein|uniref:phage tail tape measure protein n=1 Tax=Bacteroides thetaiotaomicron TaxID=818 RepID=UPI003219A339